MEPITETWEINNRINLYLLDAISEAHLSDAAVSKGRTVGEQWAHLHNVRLMWLKETVPGQWAALQKIEKGAITKGLLAAQLPASADAISVLIEKGLTEGKIRGFRPHPTAFAGYLIAHEAHHRSQVILSLKQCGHPLDKKVLYGMWEWGSR